eukprot:gene1092-1383_t
MSTKTELYNKHKALLKDILEKKNQKGEWSNIILENITSMFASINIDEKKLLLSHIDNNGETLLTYLATITNEEEINTFFRSFHQDLSYTLNIKNEFDNPPLHIAVLHQNFNFVIKLIQFKVNGSTLDHRNLMALDIAIWTSQTKMIDTLVQYGCPKSDHQIPILQFGEYMSPTYKLVSDPKPQPVLFNLSESAPSQIAFGNNFSMVLTDTGKVYSWGLCSYGKLGHKTKIDIPIPTQIEKLKNSRIVSIACGRDHSLALDDIGMIYVWGKGCGRVLGYDNNDSVPIPTPIRDIFTTGETIVSVSCGSDFSMALSKSGKVYSFGSGDMGKLGYRTETAFQSTPRQIPNITKMTQVVCGNWHTVLLSAHNEVYTFGSNLQGRLGRKTTGKDDSTPTSISFGVSTPKIKQIMCGSNFSLVIDAGNIVWVWGSNANGQLGMSSLDLPYSEKPITVKPLAPYSINSCSVGKEHILVLSNNGEIFTVGNWSNSACGINNDKDSGKDDTYFRRVGVPDGSAVFKVSAGANCSMITLSMGHQVFGEELSKLLKSDHFKDLRFIIDENYGQFIEAHRIVVACRCKKLDDLLKSEIMNPNTGNSISFSLTTKILVKTIDNIIYLSFPKIVSLESLTYFLKFLYTDHIYVTNSEHLNQIDQIAISLSMERLSFLTKTKYTNLETIPSSTLIEDFEKISNEEFLDSYSDVTFVANFEDQSEKIRSYKSLLHSRSAYFNAMLKGNFVEGNNDKKEIQFNFISEDPNDCIDLIFLADQHQCIRAKDLCSAVIRPHINPSNLCYIFNIAFQYNVHILTICCEYKLMSMKREEINNLPMFDTLSDAAKTRIFNLAK